MDTDTLYVLLLLCYLCICPLRSTCFTRSAALSVQGLGQRNYSAHLSRSGFSSPAANDGHAPTKQIETLPLKSFKGIQSKRTIKANVITVQMRNADKHPKKRKSDSHHLSKHQRNGACIHNYIIFRGFPCRARLSEKVSNILKRQREERQKQTTEYSTTSRTKPKRATRKRDYFAPAAGTRE